MKIELQDVVFVYRMHDADDIKWHTRHHSHPIGQYELHYFIGGDGQFRVGGKVHRVCPGALFVCPPQSEHSMETGVNENPISYYAVLFSLVTEKNDIEDDLLNRLLDDSTFGNTKNIGRNYRFFFEELKERSRSSSRLRRQSAQHQLLSFLYLMGAGDLPKGEPGNVHLEKALNIMQENVYEKITLADIVARLGITESYLIRLFRTKLNSTPMKYFTRLKVEAAAALLTDTPLAVYEIADRLKFYSEYHFSRVFKNYTALAPTLYRKEQFRRRI